MSAPSRNAATSAATALNGGHEAACASVMPCTAPDPGSIGVSGLTNHSRCSTPPPGSSLWTARVISRASAGDGPVHSLSMTHSGRVRLASAWRGGEGLSSGMVFLRRCRSSRAWRRRAAARRLAVLRCGLFGRVRCAVVRPVAVPGVAPGGAQRGHEAGYGLAVAVVETVLVHHDAA